MGYQHTGSNKDPVVFIHGIGGTKEYWSPLISTLSLAESASVHVYDFEGHGLTPTHPLQSITIDSLTAGLKSVLDLAEASPQSPATLIAHSLGCLVAMNFALRHPALVKKLVLLGPPPSPLSKSAANAWQDTATRVRSQGMSAIVDEVVSSQLSDHTKKTNLLAVAAVRLSLLGQDPEAFAKACSALALYTEPLEIENLQTETVIITGQEDTVSPSSLIEELANKIGNSRHIVLPNVGHWHAFEDVAGVAQSLNGVL